MARTSTAASSLAICFFIAASTLTAQQGSDRVTEIGPGESCPAGTTLIRPQRCMAPEFEAPSIVDYRPESTLVTEEHLVPRARFPAVDFHGHPRRFSTPEALAELGAALDELNVRVIVAANNVSGDELREAVAAIRASPMRDRVRVMAGIDFDDVGPGWAARAVAQLEADARAGAVAIGEISKRLGLGYTKADGSRLRIDDPDLDPVWEAAARLDLPVFIHTADPAEFFEEFDYTNERWLEQALFPNRRYPQDEYPSFEQLIEERDNLFRRHPNTTFVTAHLGWQANDLGALGRLLDELPNVHTEIGAVLYDIGRQPRTAHDFLVRYQDRILFGKDSFQPVEYPYYWRVLETADEYFDYYRDYHAFWKLYGIDLPDDVLRKLYYGNAVRLMPGMPQEGWPE
ncbi:MAG TPA: amidohydrolase family protein [Longimicrobiales bacterium]|nr:amidohydrolase family protein [Longimicrobiales bacterium]